MITRKSVENTEKQQATMNITLNNIDILKSTSDDDKNLEIEIGKLHFYLSEHHISATVQLNSTENEELTALINSIKIDNINFNDYLSILYLSTPVHISKLAGYSIRKYILSEELNLVVSVKNENNLLISIAFTFKAKSKQMFNYLKIQQLWEETHKPATDGN